MMARLLWYLDPQLDSRTPIKDNKKYLTIRGPNTKFLHNGSQQSINKHWYEQQPRPLGCFKSSYLHILAGMQC